MECDPLPVIPGSKASDFLSGFSPDVGHVGAIISLLLLFLHYCCFIAQQTSACLSKLAIISTKS